MKPGNRTLRDRVFWVWPALVLCCAGCNLPTSPAMATVPREWRKMNSWGPAGNEARAEGKLVPLSCPPREAEWTAFAREHIQDGDILFRYGIAYTPSVKFTTRLLPGICDGRFSHNAIAKWEGDCLYLYDTVPAPEGVRKIPFTFWMMDVVEGSLVIKRVKPAYRHCIPQALAYCEVAYERQVPFDSALRLDDERLYCTEMIEKAYRSAGLKLSEPLPIYCLPHYKRYLPLKPALYLFTEIRVDTPIFALGNEHYGMYASPYLELAYEACPDHPRKPPTCQSCPATVIAKPGCE